MRTLVVIVLALALISGCDDAPVKLETETGTAEIGPGSALPEALDIPIPTGADVVEGGTTSSAAFASLEFPLDRYDEVVAFYAAYVAGSDQEWTGGPTNEGSIASWVSMDTWVIMVSDCFVGGSDELNAVCVTLNQNTEG